MATTKGCLVASTNRGCKAIAESGIAFSVVLRDAVTRASVIKRICKASSIHCAVAGRNLYMRFSCSTGDAMGMNMVTKGVQNVLDYIQNYFPDMDVISLSGNFCSDKKPAAVKWILGRGKKSVVCEAVIKEEVVKKVLKTSVSALVEVNTIKKLAGSAITGALGGFNAQTSNIVPTIFIATGQDPSPECEEFSMHYHDGSSE